MLRSLEMKKGYRRTRKKTNPAPRTPGEDSCPQGPDLLRVCRANHSEEPWFRASMQHLPSDAGTRRGPVAVLGCRGVVKVQAVGTISA